MDTYGGKAWSKTLHFCSSSELSSVRQFSCFLEGVDVVSKCPMGRLFVCLFVFEGGGGGMSVTSVQFPAQLRNIHNQKAIASTKQSYGAI